MEMKVEDEKEVLVQLDGTENTEKNEEGKQPEVVVKKDGDEARESITDQVKQYEQQLEAERREKEAARQRAEAAEREAQAATARVAETELDAIDNAIAAMERENEAVQRRLKDAMEAGNFEETVKATTDLSKVAVKLNSLQEGKRYAEQRKNEQPARPSDPQEAYIQRFTPRSQQYLREHRDLITDPAKNKRLIAAHYAAEAEGYAPDTDAYFDFLDGKLGFKEAAVSNTPPPKPARNGAPPAAPISRAGGGGSGSSSDDAGVIRLTQGEARAATDGSIVWNHGPKKGEPIGLKEYARRKQIMQRNGAYETQQ